MICQDCESRFDRRSNKGKAPIYCPDCRVLRRRAAEQRCRAKHIEARRSAWADQNRRGRHGLTRDIWDQLMEAQGGMCAICDDQLTVGRGTHVDHDHQCCDRTWSCGRCVRGLLCPKCNRMLSNAKDDPRRLRAAVEYLEKAA